MASSDNLLQVLVLKLLQQGVKIPLLKTSSLPQAAAAEEVTCNLKAHIPVQLDDMSIKHGVNVDNIHLISAYKLAHVNKEKGVQLVPSH